MDLKTLLRQLWDIQANRNGGKAPACRFQLQDTSGPIEYLASSAAVLLDYKPAAPIEPGKLLKVGNLPIKELDDVGKVNPDTCLAEESIVLNRELDLTDYLLPLRNRDGEHGLGVFERRDENLVLKDVLPFSKNGCFNFVGLAVYQIPEAVLTEINNKASLQELHARICKIRTNTWMALVLSCDTAMLVVPLVKIQHTSPENENIYFDRELSERFRLDGYRDDEGFFSRLVKANNKDMKGLVNPVSRNKVATPVEAVAAAAAPVQEQQVEEVQPAQAEEIAAAASDEQPAPAQVPEESAVQEEAPKKRTRTVKKAQPTPAGSKFDDLIAYLGSPLSDKMTPEEMLEEARKLRDLGVTIARRQSNLVFAATASEKKLRDGLKGVLG